MKLLKGNKMKDVIVSFILLFISSAIMYFGYNFTAENYHLPIVTSYWHMIVIKFMFNSLTSNITIRLK